MKAEQQYIMMETGSVDHSIMRQSTASLDCPQNSVWFNSVPLWLAWSSWGLSLQRIYACIMACAYTIQYCKGTAKITSQVFSQYPIRALRKVWHAKLSASNVQSTAFSTECSCKYLFATYFPIALELLPRQAFILACKIIEWVHGCSGLQCWMHHSKWSYDI